MKWVGGPNLVHDIFKGVGAVDCETDEEEIGFWVGEWAETVVLFLTGSVP